MDISKFNFTKFDSLGNVFESYCVRRWRCFKSKRFINRAEADVVFYERDGNDGTIYVKNTTGAFSLGNVSRDNTEIEFIGDAGRVHLISKLILFLDKLIK